MRDLVQYTASELRDLDVIQSWDPPLDWSDALRPCKPCRNQKSGGVHRKCLGWYFDASERRSVVFVPSSVNGGNETRVTLAGFFSTQRTKASSSSWRRSPVASCSIAVEMTAADSDELLCRQHLDLGNIDPLQPGPVWHLQLGGVGGGEDKQQLRSIAQLRWPSLPIDFMLALELCLYSFHRDAWDDVRSRNPWRKYIKESEGLVLSHYVEKLSGYRNQSGQHDSWLAAQCNQVGILNPRPS